LSPEEKGMKEKECRSLKEYWAGDQSNPFVLERHDEAYCVCDVLFPSPIDKLKLNVRSSLVMLACNLPFSGLKAALLRMMGARIGRDVYISPRVIIDPFYSFLIEIGDGAFLGMGCTLMTHEYTAAHFRIGRVRVGRGSVIGMFSTIRAGVTIGEKVTVGAHSFVNKDVPDCETVGGVPARPIRNS